MTETKVVYTIMTGDNAAKVTINHAKPNAELTKVALMGAGSSIKNVSSGDLVKETAVKETITYDRTTE